MIREIKRSAFGSVSHLTGYGIRYPEVAAVLNGVNPGWVFADSLSEPSAALVWPRGMEGFYIIGEKVSASFLFDLDLYIQEVIVPRARHLGLRWFEFSCDRESWGPVIERVFGQRNLAHSTQCAYSLRPRDFKRSQEPADGALYDTRALDQDLLMSPLGASNLVRAKLSRFWESEAAFLARGLGCATVVGEEIASLCLSAFVAETTHAVDIETEETYRRRGFAERAARQYVELCLARSLNPHWDCMRENVASWSLAEKLGFHKTHEYSLWTFPL